MIDSRQTLEHYLNQDMIASKRKSYKKISYSDLIWRYQVHMRKTEYYLNKNKKGLNLLKYKYHKFLYNSLGVLLNYSIPLNTCEEGLYLPHIGTIVISKHAKIGKNCTINVDVNIGKQPFGENKAPILKDNIYISPGVKIFGDIKLESNIAIGANAVVNKSLSERDITIGGIPAKKISEVGTSRFV